MAIDFDDDIPAPSFVQQLRALAPSFSANPQPLCIDNELPLYGKTFGEDFRIIRFFERATLASQPISGIQTDDEVIPQLTHQLDDFYTYTALAFAAALTVPARPPLDETDDNYLPLASKQLQEDFLYYIWRAPTELTNNPPLPAYVGDDEVLPNILPKQIDEDPFSVASVQYVSNLYNYLVTGQDEIVASYPFDDSYASTIPSFTIAAAQPRPYADDEALHFSGSIVDDDYAFTQLAYAPLVFALPYADATADWVPPPLLEDLYQYTQLSYSAAITAQPFADEYVLPLQHTQLDDELNFTQLLYAAILYTTQPASLADEVVQQLTKQLDDEINFVQLALFVSQFAPQPPSLSDEIALTRIDEIYTYTALSYSVAQLTAQPPTDTFDIPFNQIEDLYQYVSLSFSASITIQPARDDNELPLQHKIVEEEFGAPVLPQGGDRPLFVFPAYDDGPQPPPPPPQPPPFILPPSGVPFEFEFPPWGEIQTSAISGVALTGYQAAPNDVALMQFGWADPNAGTISSSYNTTTMPTLLLVFVLPVYQMYNFQRVYRLNGQLYLRAGQQCIAATQGSFRVQFQQGALPGNQVYANPANGQPASGYVFGYIPTPWYVTRGCGPGGWAWISTAARIGFNPSLN